MNTFLTANGRQTMAKSAGEILLALKKREWIDLSARKLPYITIALSSAIFLLVWRGVS